MNCHDSFIVYISTGAPSSFVFCRGIWAVSNHDFIEAYACQSAVIIAFNKVFATMKDENWALPVLYVLCIDLRLFAISVSNV